MFTRHRATKCLGEHPALSFSPLLISFCFIISFQGILRVHFGELGRLNTLAVCYAMASRLSQVGSSRRLLPVGIPPVPTRQGTHPSLPGHFLLLCLAFPGSLSPLVSTTAAKRGRIPMAHLADARPRTRSRATLTMASSTHES